MAEVKALFPIGKTQWGKWDDDQRTAFNEARAEGVPYADAIEAANQTQPAKEKKKNIFDVIEDVAEIAGDIAEVGAMVSPVANVIRATTKKKAK